MNPLTFYRRRTDRPLPVPAGTNTTRPEFLDAPAGQEPPRHRLAWIRLSDLPTVAGAPVARRGIDLQAALARKVRRVPVTAIAAARRHAPALTGAGESRRVGPALAPVPRQVQR